MLLSAVLFTIIIIIIMISLLSFSMTNIIIPLPPPPLTLPPANIAFADHGQEVSITLSSAQFVPLTTTGEGNRIQVFVNYTVNDPSIINQTINSVMKVYQVNGTLIKTSSSPNGFIVNSTAGIQRHATTLSNSTIQNVIVIVQFTDIAKTVPISNSVRAELDLEKQTTIESNSDGSGGIAEFQ
jgi:hypothetical protein